jgi:DNA end-binding protein Ku
MCHVTGIAILRPHGLAIAYNHSAMPSTVWKGFISFGLVSFPVRLHSAARGKTLPFHLLHAKDNSRVREVMYCQAEDKPLTREEIVKGYEISKDEYVVVEPEELKKIAPATDKQMEILEFVKAPEIDPVFFDKSYHVAPDDNITRPYALLMEAMRETGYCGVAKISMHGSEHIVILRPSGQEIMLHTMFFVDEIQQPQVVAGDSEHFKPKELELAKRLIETLAAGFDPTKYHDEYQDSVRRMIEQKQKHQTVKSAPQPKLAPVVDIFTALEQSLAQRKGPEQAKAAKSAKQAGKKKTRSAA